MNAVCQKSFQITVGGCIYRLQSYGVGQPLFTPPVGADASGDPEWPGSVTDLVVAQYYFKVAGVDTNPAASIQGKRLHQGILDGPYVGTFFPPPTLITPADSYTRFQVSCKVGGSYSLVWVGYRLNGAGFSGVYLSGETEVASIYPPGTFSDGRPSITIESCS